MRRKSDLRPLFLALFLFLCSVLAWLWVSSDARARREATLASVPAFPAPEQAPAARHRPAQVKRELAKPAPPPQPPGARPADRLNNFALAPAHAVGVVQVNALFNSPLFDRLRECMPDNFAELERHTEKVGFDLQRDVDRVAFSENGTAISGFFEGKPIAQTMAGEGAASEEYRGQTIFQTDRGCVAQLGNLLVMDERDCRSAIDKALTPPPQPDAENELYGDVYFRADTAALSGASLGGLGDGLSRLVGALDGVTLRANVWDSVALSLEGNPAAGGDAQELAQMARGALVLARSQLEEDDVELRALADLARVEAQGGKLGVNLALPAKDLFDKLHFPCPGKAGKDAGN